MTSMKVRRAGVSPETARLMRTTAVHAVVSGAGVGMTVVVAGLLGRMGYVSRQAVETVEMYGAALLIPYWVAVVSRLHANYIWDVSRRPRASGRPATEPATGVDVRRLVGTTAIHVVGSVLIVGMIVASGALLGRVGCMCLHVVSLIKGASVGLVPYWIAVVSRLHADYIRDSSK